MTTKTQPASSALKVFKTLDALTTNFAMGLTHKDLCEATGFEGSMIVRHVATLIEAGYAEQIVETERFRPSVRFAQKSNAFLKHIANAGAKMDELKTRIDKYND